jgi:hypothetical protein
LDEHIASIFGVKKIRERGTSVSRWLQPNPRGRHSSFSFSISFCTDDISERLELNSNEKADWRVEALAVLIMEVIVF